MANPQSCRFAKSHEWIAAQGNAFRVGISDHAQHEVTDVVFAELPKVGRKVKAGEACCVIESVKAAFDIYAPIAGEIVAVNTAVSKDPALINRGPHEEGWLFELKADTADAVKSLMDYSQYQEYLKTASHAGH